MMKFRKAGLFWHSAHHHARSLKICIIRGGIYKPFTKGQLGALMPKGSEDLLDYVNAFLKEEKNSGRIDELADKYIYRHINEDMDKAA